uniref:VQ domain-containing protein n=1 Tax=Ananas comosus var. bracteatus TaxID=296719 RepID=A0A6V7QIL0_ANACO|nr:unnamed protein product [Ananas comosus var. bracteatus]
MSPSTREVAGPRPAPLKIHRDSHCIHKPNSSSSSSSITTTTASSSSSSSSSTITTNHNNNNNNNNSNVQNHQHCQPPSTTTTTTTAAPAAAAAPPGDHLHALPKVIHTDARDFMALVQKLTGLDNSSASASAASSHPPPCNGAKEGGDGANGLLPADESPTSSETCIAAGPAVAADVHVGMNCAPLVFEPFATEIPIFGPAGCGGGGGGAEFFCGPRPGGSTDIRRSPRCSPPRPHQCRISAAAARDRRSRRR